MCALVTRGAAALKLRQDTLTQSMNTIEKKVNALGVAEASVPQRDRALPGENIWDK